MPAPQRERALALFASLSRCAPRWPGARARSHNGWLGARCNAQGPEALAFRHTGGRSPFFVRAASELSDAIRTPRAAARRPSSGLIRAALDVAPPLAVRERFGRVLSRDDPSGSPRLKFPEEAKKLLGRPTRAATSVHRAAQISGRAHRPPFGPRREAHIHQDADLGYAGQARERFFVASSSPGLSAKLSFYGCTSTTKGRCGLALPAR